jgi:hypothetical protein
MALPPSCKLCQCYAQCTTTLREDSSWLSSNCHTPSGKAKRFLKRPNPQDGGRPDLDEMRNTYTASITVAKTGLGHFVNEIDQLETQALAAEATGAVSRRGFRRVQQLSRLLDDDRQGASRPHRAGGLRS